MRLRTCTPNRSYGAARIGVLVCALAREPTVELELLRARSAVVSAASAVKSARNTAPTQLSMPELELHGVCVSLELLAGEKASRRIVVDQVIGVRNRIL